MKRYKMIYKWKSLSVCISKMQDYLLLIWLSFAVLSTILTVFVVEYDDVFSFISVSSILIYFILNTIDYTIDKYLYQIKE